MMKQDAYENWLKALRNPPVPQVQHSLADYDDDNKVIGCCGLGLACLANNMALTYVDGVWPLGIPTDLESIVEQWNDNSRYTFQQIADRLEAYNRKYPFVEDVAA